MPLNPSASLVTDPQRAAALFPPSTCRQCSGTAKIQRYAQRKCEHCKTSPGWDPNGAPESVPCPECSTTPAAPGVPPEKGTGIRKFPETIPCPHCAGGKVSRVSEARPQGLATAKAGDWIRVVVEFPAIAVEDAPGRVNASAELVSCMIVKVDPRSSNILARVMQAPEYSTAHGLRHGDLLQLSANQIVAHAACTADEFEAAKRGGLFTFAPVVTIAPAIGKEYFTRAGYRARVVSIRSDAHGQYAIALVTGVGDTDYRMDGAERNGRRDYDLVQLTEVVNE